LGYAILKAVYQKLSHWKDLIAQQGASCCKIDIEMRAAERYTLAIDLDDILDSTIL
jgi:hypothetical protein